MTQAFNDSKLLPLPNDRSLCIDGLEPLHDMHPIMLRRKLNERPFCGFQGHRKHDENVYCSTLENYLPAAWSTMVSHEPLFPVRKGQLM